jgi:hypothetical protein
MFKIPFRSILMIFRFNKIFRIIIHKCTQLKIGEKFYRKLLNGRLSVDNLSNETFD